MKLCILGTGRMGAHHAEHFLAIDGVSVTACVEIDEERREAFRGRYEIADSFPTLEEALATGDFDAVANVTPDAVHYPTTMQCLATGKHVFCEKPLATNHAHAMEMTEAAEARGLVAMVNLSYRDVSAIQKAHEIVTSGAIGAVRHVEASYLQSWLAQPAWGDWQTESGWLWRLSSAHGSLGVLGDVGIHIIDFASYGADLMLDEVSCSLHTFDKAPGGRIGDYVLDANDSFAMTARFSNGALGVIHASRYATGCLNELRLAIHGDRGALRLTSNGAFGTLEYCQERDLQSPAWLDVPLHSVADNYRRFADAVHAGQTGEPSFRRAAEMQKIIDCAVASNAQKRPIAVNQDL